MGESPMKSATGLSHIKATVLWAIIPEIFFFTSIAAAVCLLSEYVHNLDIATTLITVFGTVLGFLVSFRTSSAFASYTEGRRLWSNIILASRSFSRIAWLHVPNYINPPAEGEEVSDDEKRRAIVEKKSAVNLIAAFSVATQHYCRGEAGIYYTDLYPLVCYLPRYRLPTSNYIARPDLDPLHVAQSDPSALETLSASALASFSASGSTFAAATPLLSRNSSIVSGVSGFSGPGGLHERKPTWSTTEPVMDPTTGGQISHIKSPRPLLPARNPPPVSLDDWIPFYGLFHDIYSLCRGRARQLHKVARGKKDYHRRKRQPIQGQKNGDHVPLEITLLLSGWVAALQRRKSIDVPTINSLLAALQSFSDSLTGLERVLLSPIPLAYSIHLRQVIWIYLLFLPTQLRATFGWLTVPATAITTFCFLGFLQIGNEIENPLGYDSSDLDLEAFTAVIRKELREMTAHPMEEADPANFFFVDSNLPFATAPEWSGQSARQIIEEEVPLEELAARLKAGGGQPTLAEREAELLKKATERERAERHPYRGSLKKTQGV